METNINKLTKAELIQIVETQNVKLAELIQSEADYKTQITAKNSIIKELEEDKKVLSDDYYRAIDNKDKWVANYSLQERVLEAVRSIVKVVD